MARLERTFTVTTKGRDLNKQFLLTEMPARQSEAWGMRALLALARSGVEMPDNLASAGLAGFAIFGLRALAGVNFADAEPLLAEMLAQVQIIPDPSRPTVRRALIDDDTEEVATLLQLRKEIFELHAQAFIDAGLWAKVRENLGTTGPSSPIQTSAAQ